ncbi:hypothetical protein D9M72_264940 [compost metagenome]
MGIDTHPIREDLRWNDVADGEALRRANADDPGACGHRLRRPGIACAIGTETLPFTVHDRRDAEPGSVARQRPICSDGDGVRVVVEEERRRPHGFAGTGPLAVVPVIDRQDAARLHLVVLQQDQVGGRALAERLAADHHPRARRHPQRTATAHPVAPDVAIRIQQAVGCHRGQAEAVRQQVHITAAPAARLAVGQHRTAR